MNNDLLKKFAQSFVQDFESDFVYDGEIVDNPEQLWTPLIRLYFEAKEALKNESEYDI